MVREKIDEAQRAIGWVTRASIKRDRLGHDDDGDGYGRTVRGGSGGGGGGGASNRKKEKYGDAAEYEAMYGSG